MEQKVTTPLLLSEQLSQKWEFGKKYNSLLTKE